MKKYVLVLALIGLSLALVTAEAIELGTFPVGSWVDSNYGAVWELTSSNIRILDSTSGALLWDFNEKGVTDFKVEAGVDGAGISFSCAAAGMTGKSYKLIKTLTDGNVVLTITQKELPEYKTTMKPK